MFQTLLLLLLIKVNVLVKFKTNLTIAHEMVHVMQMIRGDVFDMSKAYKHQEHEKEAYAMEKELVRVCN